MHSPFVFNFILDVLNNRQEYVPPDAIEQLRIELKKQKKQLVIEDLGAGSRISNTKQRTIAQLARTVVKPKKYSQLLYRLAKKYNPKTIVELGTSLGVTTAYLATAAPNAKVITIEGSSAIQQLAQKNFQQLNLQNIQSLHGHFNDVLPSVIQQLSSVNIAFVDGNHRNQPTTFSIANTTAKKPRRSAK